MGGITIWLTREEVELIRNAISTEYYHLKDLGDTPAIDALIKVELKINDSLREAE